MSEETYKDALQAVKDSRMVIDGLNVVRMIADGHATAHFKSASIRSCGAQPDRYILMLTDAGAAALRGFKTWRSR